MKVPFYVVAIGKNKDQYLDSSNYLIYQSFTKDIMNAKKFMDKDKALKYAKKTNGEVLDFFVIDEKETDIEKEELREKLYKKEKEYEILKQSFEKITGGR